MTSRLDHVALNVAHFEEALEFFQTVFGMEVTKVNGDAPMRKVWLKQGIQLNEVPQKPSETGVVDHIAIRVEDVSAIMNEVKCRNLTLISGKENWFYLSNGIVIELVFC